MSLLSCQNQLTGKTPVIFYSIPKIHEIEGKTPVNIDICRSK